LQAFSKQAAVVWRFPRFVRAKTIAVLIARTQYLAQT